MLIKQVKLKYFRGDNLLEKKRVTATVVTLLYRKHVNLEAIGNWLNIPTQRVNDFVLSTLPILYRSPNFPIFRSDVKRNVKWFLKHQHFVIINRKSFNYIRELLATPLSTSQIARGSRVKQPVISYLRNGKRQISKLSLLTANRLISCYLKIKTWQSTESVCRIGSQYNDENGFGFGWASKQQLANPNYIFPTHSFSDSIYRTIQKHFDSDFTILYGSHHNQTFGVIISNNRPNVWYQINSHPLPKQFQRAVNEYARIQPHYRANNDALYMSRDLKRKTKQILNLHRKGLNPKQIAKKLHLNSYLIKQTLA